MAISWGVLGLSLWATLRAMGIDYPGMLAQWPRWTASVALAMVAGFLSLVPGGAVVREAILTELMVPHLRGVTAVTSAPATALVAAVLLRLVWLVSELLISGILYLNGTWASGARSADG